MLGDTRRVGDLPGRGTAIVLAGEEVLSLGQQQPTRLATRAAGRRVVAIGTTTLRALASALTL